MRRLLSDVDGCAGDLMGRDSGGFKRWLLEKRGIEFDPEAPANLRTSGVNRQHLLEFLRTPHCYVDYVNPIPGAVETLAELVGCGLELRWVTSITEEPAQYPAKDEWLEEHFGGIEYETLTIPSREKHFHMGDYMIDDRADTIARFLEVGQRRGVFLFSQPWNFAYGEDGYWRDREQFHRVAAAHNSVYMRRGPGGFLVQRTFVGITDEWRRIGRMIREDAGV